MINLDCGKRRRKRGRRCPRRASILYDRCRLTKVRRQPKIAAARTRQSCKSMVEHLAAGVDEIFPWNLADEIEVNPDLLLLDVRCPREFHRASIRNSHNVPRGILEMAVDCGYEETEPELVEARARPAKGRADLEALMRRPHSLLRFAPPAQPSLLSVKMRPNWNGTGE